MRSLYGKRKSPCQEFADIPGRGSDIQQEFYATFRMSLYRSIVHEFPFSIRHAPLLGKVFSLRSSSVFVLLLNFFEDIEP
jgi:hypothetical protein